jgi:hypothetical protein
MNGIIIYVFCKNAKKVFNFKGNHRFNKFTPFFALLKGEA